MWSSPYGWIATARQQESTARTWLGMWDETLGGYFVLWWRKVKVWSVISHTSRNAPLEGVGNPPAIPREYSAVQGERNCSLLTGNYREACVPNLTDPGIGIIIWVFGSLSRGVLLLYWGAKTLSSEKCTCAVTRCGCWIWFPLAQPSTQRTSPRRRSGPGGVHRRGYISAAPADLLWSPRFIRRSAQPNGHVTGPEIIQAQPLYRFLRKNATVEQCAKLALDFPCDFC